MRSVPPTLRPRARLPRGRPPELEGEGLPWRFTYTKLRGSRLAPDDRPRERARPAPIHLGWDEGPWIDRIAWLSVARSLIAAGDCTSFLGALDLIPADVWSQEELIGLDRKLAERARRPRRNRDAQAMPLDISKARGSYWDVG